ncbi:MAG: hypothetical protein ACK506_19010 [Pirellula sp.]
MELSDLTEEQLGKILFRVNHQSRKAAKSYLHTLGCPADSEALDAAVAMAQASEVAKQAAAEIKESREEIGSGLDAAAVTESNRVLDILKEQVESLEVGKVEFANLIEWPPSLLTNMLSGRKTMTLLDLCRLLVAMDLEFQVKKKK